jgi:hypothetical protein
VLDSKTARVAAFHLVRHQTAGWTFCLTVIALDLGVLPHETGWIFTADRIMLTMGGLALAALFSGRLIRA